MNEKKLILIMPKFHDYADKITNEVKKLGYSVRVYYETPKPFVNLVLKNLAYLFGFHPVFYLFNKQLFKKINRENKYVSNIVVIRGDILDSKMLIDCINKTIIKGGVSTYYSWDSFQNMHQGLLLGNYFKKKYTFDSKDAKENSGWELLPLFYSKEYDKDISFSCNKNYKYDLCCITGLSIQKYELLDKVIKANPELKIYCRFYLDKRILRIKKLTDKRFRNMDCKLVITNEMSTDEILDLYYNSRAILDLPSLKQSGLSLRTIESLGLRKKLVTINEHIKEYDFYSEDNFWVLTGNYSIDPNWFNREYTIDDSIREKYSIVSWINNLLYSSCVDNNNNQKLSNSFMDIIKA